MDSKLQQLIESARHRQMSEEEIETQRVNFAFGNAPEEDDGTIETVRAASTIIKQTDSTK